MNHNQGEKADNSTAISATTVAFLSSRANALLPSSCGHQSPCLNSKCVNQIVTFVDLNAIAYASDMHSASKDIYTFYCLILPRCHFQCWAYVACVRKSMRNIGQLVTKQTPCGAQGPKNAIEFPLSQNMQPHPHCCRNKTSDINSL